MTRPEEVQVRAGGLSFRGVAWPGGAPPVLLFHATSYCADVWIPVWEAARAAGAADLHAVAFDQRGHGGSSAPSAPEAYAWTRLVDDVLALTETLDQSRAGVVLVGHSSGASACLAAACRRPERVRGVALVEPVLFDPPRGPDADSFAGSRYLAGRARTRRASFASRSEARRRLTAVAPTAGFPPAVLEAYLAGGFAAADGRVALRCRPEVEAWAYEGAAALDLWPLLAKLQAPLRLLLAEHSAVPAPLLARLVERVPALAIERIEGATHFAALERPEPVGRALGAFLAELR